MIYTPIVLDLLKISKDEFGIAVTFFGVFVILSNLLSSRFLIPKIGTTNCLKISRIIISFVPLSVFYFETYYFLILSYAIFGIGMGIQAPCALTQVTIIENKTIFCGLSEIFLAIAAGIISIPVINNRPTILIDMAITAAIRIVKIAFALSGFNPSASANS